MQFEVNLSGQQAAISLLEGLDSKNLDKAITTSAKRAATAARTSGTKGIRQIYTIKSRDMKSRTQIKSGSGGAILRVRGSQEPVKKYSARQNKRGLFVTIKHGNRFKVTRGFNLSGSFVARRGKERYPLRGLYGPAAPQLFGNPPVAEAMQDRANEVFIARLSHEIEYRMGV